MAAMLLASLRKLSREGSRPNPDIHSCLQFAVMVNPTHTCFLPVIASKCVLPLLPRVMHAPHKMFGTAGVGLCLIRLAANHC